MTTVGGAASPPPRACHLAPPCGPAPSLPSSSLRLSKTQLMHNPLIAEFQFKGLEYGNWEECGVTDAGLTSV